MADGGRAGRINLAGGWPGRKLLAKRLARALLGFVLAVNVPPPAAGQQVLRERIEAHWLADGTRFWYRVDSGEGGAEFVLVDAARGERRPAFDHAEVARKLEELTGRSHTAATLDLRELAFNDDGQSLELSGPGLRCRLDLATGELVLQDAAPAPAPPLFRTPRPSRDEGGDSGLQITNAMPVPLSLFWIDRSGSRVPYGQIQPGETRGQHTFAGHVFLVEGEGLEGGVCFVAGPEPAEVVINPQAVAGAIEGAPRGAARRGRSGIGRRDARRNGPPVARGAKSPDGAWTVQVRNDNLWIRRTGEEKWIELTRDAAADNTFRRDTSRARLVGMQYGLPEAPADEPDLLWSPDGRAVLAWQTRQVPERRVHYIESLPAGSVQPELRSYPYLKAGDALPIARPRLFALDPPREIPVATDLFPDPWELRFVRWSPDGSRCYLLFNQRGHQLIRLLELDAASGVVRTVVEERSATFIHYSDPDKSELRWLEDGTLLWASERSGWNHLYRYDVASGEVLHAVTAGEWNVRRIERIDEQTGTLWFFAVGIIPGQDPYHEHFCRVNLDGTDLRVLTAGDGMHEIEWSPDRRWFVDRYSRVDLPPVHELRTADGELVCHLETADVSRWEARGGRMPVRFVAKGRDGETDIWGVIHFPRDFREELRYPVLEQIYAGPHDHHVPKRFAARHGARRLADEGFIVVQIDGMGTAWRSKAFHDVCWRNLRDAGFPDRIAWIRAAARKYPQLDLERVGVYGGSAGGQNAMAAVLWHSDFYRAAAADCGCHDNRMDKIWWSEQWMGWPVGEHYAANSNMENAHLLGGALLLTVGELDRNVDPATTTQVAGRLIQANKDFEFLLVVGGGHGSGDSPWAARRRLDFFRRHLGGPGPASDDPVRPGQMP